MEKIVPEPSIEKVSDQDFNRIMSEQRPDMTPTTIERSRAAHAGDKSGRVLLNTDGLPERFVPYLETHVLWEIRMANRKGFNLANLARRHAKAALKEIDPRMPEKRVDRLLETFVGEHRFDLKHEFAVWKEYQHAEADGTLDEYHAFVMTLKEEEQKKYAQNPSIFRETRNDMAIRQSILNKIRTGSKHHFNKKLTA